MLAAAINFVDTGGSTHLRGDDDLIAVPAGFQPFSDDRFRLSTGSAIHPIRVHVSGVDKVEAGVGESIQDLEGTLFIEGPSKGIATQIKGGDMQISLSYSCFFHSVVFYFSL